MRKTVTILAVLVALSARAVWADDDCFVPMAEWQTREAAAAFAVAQGWDVRRIRIDDGCYEIDGRDATGRAIEVKLHPGTLQIVEFEVEEDDHGREREGREND